MKKGTSKYAAYREEIVDMLNAGLSISEIVDKLSYREDLYPVYYETLYSYIKGNGLHSLDYRGNKTITPPICNNCEHCTEHINFDGTDTIRECVKGRQLIRNSVRTSPDWCFRREKKIS